MAQATTLPQTSALKQDMVVYYADEHGAGFEIPALHIEVVLDSHGITEEIDRHPVASQTWGLLWSFCKSWFGLGFCFCLSPLFFFVKKDGNEEEEKDDEDIS